jgi:predicted 3-demethylubiquinone-9 3-methyltransferase (glyoxalase superfamily)
MQKISPFLWFDHQAEEAANFYVSVFKNSNITQINRYSDAGKDVHGQEPGSVMTVAFELNGSPFVALNGGPVFTFNEAISFEIPCDDQAEIDYYWEKLSAVPESEQCGWCKDKYGVSWQVVPAIMPTLLADATSAQAAAVTNVIMKSKKFDIAELQRAYDEAK